MKRSFQVLGGGLSSSFFARSLILKRMNPQVIEIKMFEFCIHKFFLYPPFYEVRVICWQYPNPKSFIVR